ncbi:NPCBM/NEW2 domain-containing protein [Herbiconiux sp. CPCC 205763]|uniref:Alpha-galactosidase n=1 Tax=Herbiconiux aconitum TaxID=2970913 RepID=A0ABT2GS64_9MICO|nr:NPCBM/NEW2 domain-containing protein [Herbiconiux aconitum]MCS5719068.1 NPCBM/NEW2 domain-containing protein [Herbiconiux aconitum]
MAAATVTTLALVGVALPAAASAASAPPDAVPRSVSDPSLSPTPYQGWNTYYGLGGDFSTTEVLDVADFLVSSGLAASGYDIVWLDGGWQADTPRGDDGLLQGDPERFPEGMKALADAIHERGLRAGIYTDAGPYIPGSCGLGSYGHYQTDADTFAAWGYDAVKVDFLCGITADLDPQTVYTEFAEALRNNSSGRPIIFNLCNPVTSPDWGDYPEEQQSTHSWSYAPGIAESWRTYTDSGFVGMMKYSDMLRNYDANARHPEAAGPGHWNDPDYVGPELGMTDEEFRTQMTLWSVAAAPLVIASDPRTLSATSLATLMDPEMLAINQDSLGRQAVRVGEAGDTETWLKPLADGSVAVALLNRSDAPAQISVETDALGLKGSRFTVADAWTDAVTESKRTVRAAVAAHGTSLLRISPARGLPGVPRITVDAPTVTAVDGATIDPSGAVLVAGGSTLTTEVTVHNDGLTPVVLPTITLAAPEGWVATPTGRKPHLVAPGHSADAAFTIAVPADAPVGTSAANASVAFRPLVLHSATTTVSSPPLTVTIAPAPPSGTEIALSHHQWVSGTSGWMEPTIDQSVGGGNPITVAGTTYGTGIGVASPSDIRYYLGGRCTTLTGVAGIDDVVGTVGPDGGTATFEVSGDGAPLWQSGTVARGSANAFEVDLSGVDELVLHVGDAGDGGYNDRANWADPLITCE